MCKVIYRERNIVVYEGSEADCEIWVEQHDSEAYSIVYVS